MELAERIISKGEILAIPVNAADFFPRLAFGPLLETGLVDIVAARGFAPHYFFGVGSEFCETYRAVSRDFFAMGWCASGGGGY